MSEIVTNLFVYGTLMPGESNYRQIENFVIDYKPGTVDGVLVDLGAYPALIHGEGHVKGIMLLVNEEVLRITDRIECYQENREDCLYFREKIIVRRDGDQEVEAWTYLFANSESVADCPRLVVGELNGVPLHAWSRL